MISKNNKVLNGLTGVFGFLVIILSIILLSNKDLSELHKLTTSTVLQLCLGILFIVTGIRENATKGKPKGNMFLYVGAAILVTMAYGAYVLIAKMAV
jgi:hypothetical protein